MIKATNIKWDYDLQIECLPCEVLIPFEVEEDNVADVLSDMYGFCVVGCDIEEVE